MDCNLQNYIDPYTYSDIKEICSRELPWSRFKEQTVLITGANGFIGSYLVFSLLHLNDTEQLNIKVVGLVRSYEKAYQKFGSLLQREDFELLIQDVCIPIPDSVKADYIIHAASQASAAFFESDPVGTISANLTGTINALECARKSGAKSILLISSLKVYGDLTNITAPLAEEKLGELNCLSYKNCYAQGKRTAETIGACYAKEYHLNVKIARPSYIYGASTLHDDRVWAQFISNIVKHENILLKSSGAVLRSFCYVADTAAALFTILLNGENVYPYNIASKESNLTIRDFARTAVLVFSERGLKLSFANPEDEKEPSEEILKKNMEVLEDIRIHTLGWSAKVNIAEGIRRAVAILEYKGKKNEV